MPEKLKVLFFIKENVVATEQGVNAITEDLVMSPGLFCGVIFD